MRKPEYLSPTSISLFFSKPEEFYMTYLADNRPPKLPQTKPMSVGSSFDAYAKSYLHTKLFGVGHVDSPKFQFEAIFDSQVEPQNRDYAKVAGRRCFDVYFHSGAMADLMLELQQSISEPQFEFEVTGVIQGSKEGYTRTLTDGSSIGVPMRGKPDVRFVNKFNARVVLDWKVNGYDSKWGASPMKGYVRLREDGYNKGSHKDSQLLIDRGILINVSGNLEDYNKDWARQLAIYSWLCGEEIGSDNITAIDQIVCRPNGSIKIAEHRTKVSPAYQWEVFQQAQTIIEVINSDHFFRDMTKEDSQARCEMLDKVTQDLLKPQSENDQWLNEITRQH